jgi:guanosine-3',5'-bis(diphosphate) 3'-pyrophosphohydrolase
LSFDKFLVSSQLGNQNMKPYEAKIDQESLAKAANQLWALLSPKLSYLAPEKRDFVRLAFDFMVEMHAEQRRKSGDFYIIHPVNAAITLAEIEFDKESIAAALLHDVPEDVCKKPTEGIKLIEREFGAETAFLVAGITKLSVIRYLGEKKQVENLRKLFVAMSKDLRVIFIKLADRIHNLRTLKSVPPDKARRIALESLEIYAPIAERLGVGSLRSQLEEAAFGYAYPTESKYYLSLPDLDYNKRTKQVEKLVKKTTSILDQNNMPYLKITGRAKHHYSTFKKVTLEAKPLDQIYDLVALRIITNSVSNCYKTLSLLHEHFEVLPERLKDYIQEPKDNGYQSIHLTVKDPKSGLTFEYQIRTQRMHEYAEYGVAAHWWYKENLTGDDRENWLTKKSFQWIQSLIDLEQKYAPEVEYMKNVRLNLYPDRIFVLTPQNDVIDLPKGASPIDFAYKIHEDVGSHAVMAKINGKIAKLNEELQNGDIVEIVTSRNQKPNADWLNWAKSGSSMKKIRAFLRNIGVNFVAKDDHEKDKKKHL